MGQQLSDTEELYAISEATNEGGTIDVELHDFTKTEADGRVSVEFITPTGDVESEVMVWPQEDTSEYKFVRLFDQAGYGIISAEEACENGVTVETNRVNGDNWRLYVPEETSLRERISHTLWGMKENGLGSGSQDWNGWVSLLLAPLFGPFISAHYVVSSTNMNDVAIGYGMAGLHMILWTIVIIGCLLLIGVPLPIV